MPSGKNPVHSSFHLGWPQGGASSRCKFLITCLGVIAVGAFIAVDFCVGSLVKHAWMLGGGSHASQLMPAAATGLIAGDGLWALPAALLAIIGIDPPICMTFTAASA